MRQATRDQIIGQALVSGYCTWDELHDAGPGKFQGERDRPLTIALYAISSYTFYDESTGAIDAPDGYVCRIDRWLLYLNVDGFVSAVEYTDEANARIAFRDLDARYTAWLEGAE